MEYSKLIHEFADGTLESGNEEELFRLLASNEDYRGELKQQIAMKNAIKIDAKAYTPSAASTLKIFSSIGFTPSTPAPTSGIAGSAQNHQLLLEGSSSRK